MAEYSACTAGCDLGPSSIKPDHSSSQVNRTQKISFPLIVACRNRPLLFEFGSYVINSVGGLCTSPCHTHGVWRDFAWAELLLSCFVPEVAQSLAHPSRILCPLYPVSDTSLGSR